MIGKKFGELTVTERLGQLKQWVCVCSCDNVKVVKECKLLSGHTSSCGCQRSKTPQRHMLNEAVAANRKLSKGMLFGRLVILSTYPTVAKCDCGNEVKITRTGSLYSGDTKSCGCLNRDNAREKQRRLTVEHRVKKGFNPDTAMDPINKAQRDRFKKTLAPSIMARDKYTCALCNERGGILHVHHIVRWSDVASLRFKKSNLVTLCKKCHIQTAHDGNVHNECNKDIARDLTDIVAKRMDL
jgi:5-methylcytosine-specific restriction endonuclease McrA